MHFCYLSIKRDSLALFSFLITLDRRGAVFSLAFSVICVWLKANLLKTDERAGETSERRDQIKGESREETQVSDEKA